MTMKTEARAQAVQTVAKFESDLHNLLALMNKADVKTLAPGAAYTVYTTTNASFPAQVAEGEEITNMGIGTAVDRVVELTYRKYRNLTGIESIGKYGYDVAVGATNDDLLARVSDALHTEIAQGIFEDVNESAAKPTMQAAIANAWSQIQVAYANRRFEAVYFVHPTTAESYLATADISTQAAFGMTYVQNFMGLGTLIIDPFVEPGKVYGTAKENIDIVSADLAAVPDMDMTMDAAGVLGVHVDAEYSNAAIESVVYSGLAAFPVFSDHAFIVPIGA